MRQSAIINDFVEQGRSERCPVIDVHTHYGPFRGIYFPLLSDAEVLGTLDRCGVRLMISAHHAAFQDMKRGHDEISRAATAAPGRLYAYVCCNPCYPDEMRAELGRLDTDPAFVGIKFLSSYHQVPINDKRYEPALSLADERHLPVLMHTWGQNQYCSPALWPELAEKYPGAVFFMGHSGFGQWEDAIRYATQYPNVYLELCAAYATRGFVEMAVARCGAEKVLFGTDLPWFDPHYGIGCVIFCDIDDDARYKILYGNAEGILKDCGILKSE